MKQFVGICCAMLLCLSACGDIDSPKLPPARVELHDIQSLTDLSFSELAELDDNWGIGADYRNSRVFLLAGDVILDSPNQSYSTVQFFISPDKNLLTGEYFWNSYSDYENIHMLYAENRGGKLMGVANLSWKDWESDTYYYCMVAANWGWEGNPGILDDCLQQDGRQATVSSIKSITVPTKFAPYADIYFSEPQQAIQAYFDMSQFTDISLIGICYSADNELPTVNDPSFTGDATSGRLSFPFPHWAGAYYFRPFFVTKDDVTVYGYVQMLHIG